MTGNGKTDWRVGVFYNPQGAATTSYAQLTLPDPKTGQDRTYLLSSEGHILEVNQHKRLFSAWLIDDLLLSDGSLFLATPVDVVFLLLPLLDKAQATARGNFCPADQLLCFDSHPDAVLIASHLSGALVCVCDSKTVAGETYHKLNPDKLLAWMVCKAEHLAVVLPHQQGQVVPADGPSLQLQYAIGFLEEYLSEKNHKLLAEYCGVHMATQVTMNSTRNHNRPHEAAAENLEPVDKRQKLDVPAKPDLKAVRFAKSAAGTKKMSAFFGKK